MNTLPTRLLLLCLSGLFTMAQQVAAQSLCATELDEVDPFTRMRAVTVSTPGSSTGPAFRWRALDLSSTLELSVVQDGTKPLVIFEGDSLLLMLETDSLMVLISTGTEVSTLDTNALGQPCMRGTFTYALSQHQVGQLSHYWVVRLRLQHRHGRLEYEATRDPIWPSALQRSASCFQEVCAAATPLPVRSLLSERQDAILRGH